MHKRSKIRVNSQVTASDRSDQAPAGASQPSGYETPVNSHQGQKFTPQVGAQMVSFTAEKPQTSDTT